MNARNEVDEKLLVQPRYSIAKRCGLDGVHDPSVLVPSLSIPSTDTRARQSDNSVLEGTFHMARVDRAAGFVLRDEEGSGDTRVPALGYAVQMFHLLVTCGPTRIDEKSRD